MTDDAERFEELGEDTQSVLCGYFRAIDHLLCKADHHNEWVQDGVNVAHHRACRNTAYNQAMELFREAITAALSPDVSRYYFDDGDADVPQEDQEAYYPPAERA